MVPGQPRAPLESRCLPSFTEQFLSPRYFFGMRSEKRGKRATHHRATNTGHVPLSLLFPLPYFSSTHDVGGVGERADHTRQSQPLCRSPVSLLRFTVYSFITGDNQSITTQTGRRVRRITIIALRRGFWVRPLLGPRVGGAPGFMSNTFSIGPGG